MKPNKTTWVLAALSLWAPWAWAGSLPGASLELKPESKLWLEGDSTLHAFSSTATALGAVVEIASPGAALKDAVQGGQVTRLEVNVPVQNLKSGESGLDKRMHAALKAKDYPEITFRMQRYEVLPGGDDLTIKAAGQLSIAGTEKPVELEARAQAGADSLHVQGQKDVLMTDYGIKPPTFLGMLKTKDRVVVHFDLVLGKENEEKRRLP